MYCWRQDGKYEIVHVSVLHNVMSSELQYHMKYLKFLSAQFSFWIKYKSIEGGFIEILQIIGQNTEML